MDACFVSACSRLDQLPAPGLPEVAVAGRSNCGKSSLINALVGRKGLARTSSTPGRTRQIVYFQATLPGCAPFYLVDLPGYGYARAARADKEAWGELVTRYVDTRAPLKALMLLVDIRRGPTAAEADLLRWTAQRGITPLVVLTKADKLSKSRRKPAALAAQQALSLSSAPLLSSAQDRSGVEALRRALTRLVPQVAR